MDMRNVPQLPQIRTNPHPLGGRRHSRRRADIPVPMATEVLCDSPLKLFVTNDNEGRSIRSIARHFNVGVATIDRIKKAQSSPI